MKKILSIAVILLATIALNAQTFDAPLVRAGESELQINFGMASTALDSAAADTSDYFSLEDYDGGIGNFATLFYNFTCSGTAKTNIDIYGCETATGTYKVMDAVLADGATEGGAWVAFDVGGARAKYYKVIVTNQATGNALQGYNIIIRAHQKDNGL